MRWLVCFFLTCMVLFVSAWNWETHAALAESVFYALEENMSALLDLSLLRNGSIAPDRDFHDNRLHHYPPAYNKTLFWLVETREALVQHNYSHASYAFGVASHYVSDSFSAPHNIVKEPYALHKLYEDQGGTAYFFISCNETKQKLSLQKHLPIAVEEGKSWKQWVETKDSRIPMQAVAKAYPLVLSLALDTFSATCRHKKTTIVADNFSSIDGWDILLTGVLLSLLLLTIFSLLKDV